MEQRLKIFIVLITAIFMSGCAGKKQPITQTALLLDTVCTITIYDSVDISLLTEAFDLCSQYEELLSRTVPQSDIWRINNAGGETVTIDPRTAELLQMALEYSEMSNGAFDVTVGRLSELWDFSGEPVIPADAEISEALETIGFRQIEIAGDDVKLKNTQTRLDLGAIAKGYIADKIAEFLTERGVNAAVIDLGGNIVCVGSKPDGKLWNIGIRKPFGGVEMIGVLTTGEAAVVTAGVYERSFEQNGTLYHHILDPATGMPAKSDVISATVLTEDSAAGDALSTIAVLIGSAGAQTLFKNAPDFIGAVLILENGELLQFGEIAYEPRQ